MWVSFNANPTAERVGDCTVRAISKALESSLLRVEDMGMIMDEIMNDPNTPPHEKETLRKAVDILQR